MRRKICSRRCQQNPVYNDANAQPPSPSGSCPWSEWHPSPGNSPKKDGHGYMEIPRTLNAESDPLGRKVKRTFKKENKCILDDVVIE